jgi:DNA replication and repair protein RecF
MAEKAVAIAIARVDAVSIIQDAIYKAPSAFPKAEICADGTVEKMVGISPALEIEESLKKQFYNSRSDDARSGRTMVGTHRSDFRVTHIEKNMPAEFCSTGEQKALLLAIILAEARAKAAWRNTVPVLLLDEVVAHLDSVRRTALFDEFTAMGAQVWITGTDTSLFAELQGRAQFLEVSDGVVNYTQY